MMTRSLLLLALQPAGCAEPDPPPHQTRAPATPRVFRRGRRVEQVDRRVEAGVGLTGRAGPRAGRLEERHELARLEVSAPVERHVFDEVREPLLIVRLVERAGLHGQADSLSLIHISDPPSPY